MCVCMHRWGPHRVRVGDIFLNYKGDDDTLVKEYKVEEYKIHPRYLRKKSIYNDIALVKTTTRIKFNEKVSPACLDTPFLSDRYDYTISGWGSTDANNFSKFFTFISFIHPY